MSLEMRWPKSKWFYGRPTINGKKQFVNLGVQIKGTPPKNLYEKGDTAFERSRSRAETALKELQLETKRVGKSEELIKKIHELRTGTQIGSIRLENMFDAWQQIPRKRKSSTRYVKQVCSLFDRFVGFVRQRHPKVVEMTHVRSKMVKEFLRAEEERGITGKTYNNELILLRSTFENLRKDAGLAENPFEGIPTKVEDTVFRIPFTPEELAVITEAARRKEHQFIRPAIFVSMCTAMRKGDCCLLKEPDIDLKARFISVKTAKTGGRVDIPMFPLLYEEIKRSLETVGREKSPEKYLFPELAKMYRSNPDGITWRVRKVLKEAGFYDRVVKENDDNHKGDIHVEREVGLRKASRFDFHSFRVTWVTLALLSGVEMELIKKVTGHRTVDVVLTHYFQPGREDFRRALEAKMPQLMISGESAIPTAGQEKLTEILRLAKGLDAKNWKQKKAEIIDLVSPFVA